MPTGKGGEGEKEGKEIVLIGGSPGWSSMEVLKRGWREISRISISITAPPFRDDYPDNTSRLFQIKIS